jgi:spore photoproduct lyase family protein
MNLKKVHHNMTLFQINKIYYEPEAAKNARGIEIWKQFKDAQKVKVVSHWNIPELHANANSVEDWNKIKREVLVLGIKQKLYCRENGRSTDFIAPSHSNGCSMACAYCYVARRKGYANPVTVFTNIDKITAFIKNHANTLGPKATPNQCDPIYWTYDIGENSDCSADALISNNLKDIVALFKDIPNAKACFATKYVNHELLNYDPQGKTRIRFSLMPHDKAKLFDVRTSSISDRIAAINDFVDAGYEVHLNFSPIVIYEGWSKDWENLLKEVDDSISEQAKSQLKCEVIFLTHNQELHQINNKWHPKAEELLWKPEWQETKVSETGGKNVRYKYPAKNKMVNHFISMVNNIIPYCKVRYAF